MKEITIGESGVFNVPLGNLDLIESILLAIALFALLASMVIFISKR